MTDDLARRIWEHKSKAITGFTVKYGCDQLIWYETHDMRETALVPQRQIKDWRRC